MLGARDQLVKAKRSLGNQVRGLLRPFGIRLPSRVGAKKFAAAAYQATRNDPLMHASINALLESLASIDAQVAKLDDGITPCLAGPKPKPWIWDRWASIRFSRRAVRHAAVAITRVKDAGGQIIHGPMQVPGGSWIAHGLDPQDAIFAMVGPKG